MDLKTAHTSFLWIQGSHCQLLLLYGTKNNNICMSPFVCHIWMCYPCTYYEWLFSCTNLLENVSRFLLKLPFPCNAGCHYHDSVYNFVTCQHTYRAVVLAHGYQRSIPRSPLARQQSDNPYHIPNVAKTKKYLSTKWVFSCVRAVWWILWILKDTGLARIDHKSLLTISENIRSSNSSLNCHRLL